MELEAYRQADRLSGRYSVWRSPRERAVWLRDVRRAQLSQSPAAAMYVTATLVDRAETLVKVSIDMKQGPAAKHTLLVPYQGVDNIECLLFAHRLE